MSEPRRFWVTMKYGHPINVTATKPTEGQMKADRLMYNYEYVEVQEIPKEPQ